MARFSTGLRVLERRLRKIEAKKCSGKFPSALRKFGLTGEMPEEDLLQIQIKLTLATIKAMKETLPHDPEQK